MKVLYDHQTFAEQEYGGVSRYFYELMRDHAATGEADFRLALSFSNNAYIEGSPFAPHRHFFRGLRFRGKRRVLLALNRRTAIKFLKKGDYDVFHPTYYSPYFLEYCRKPFVLTVHDMIHERFPEYFPPWDHTAEEKKLLCSRADRILAVSGRTKSDLVELLGVPSEKITVVYHGSSMDSRKQSPVRVPGRYLLFVGKREAYKNFSLLAEAAAELMAKDRELFLVCAGGGPLTAAETAELQRLGLRERVVWTSVSDSVLAYLYSNALCFIFPSAYEGFGIPILEAFSCACPVVLSDASCFPEVAGDAALYFSSGNKESLAASLSRVVLERELRESLKDRGAARLREFSWGKCAAEVRKVYCELA